MAELKVLVEGYARKTETGWVASSTVCLITAGKKRILTDPGCNREKLLDALRKEGLTTKDIDYVFLSHCHPDHTLLAGIFESAKFVTFDGNMEYDNDHLAEFDSHVLGDDIEIIETPGHVAEHISLILNTDSGKVAIAGDAIWWMDGESQVFRLDQKDNSQAMDMGKLLESRRQIIERADYVVPGHGKMFKVRK